MIDAYVFPDPSRSKYQPLREHATAWILYDALGQKLCRIRACYAFVGATFEQAGNPRMFVQYFELDQSYTRPAGQLEGFYLAGLSETYHIQEGTPVELENLLRREIGVNIVGRWLADPEPEPLLDNRPYPVLRAMVGDLRRHNRGDWPGE